MKSNTLVYFILLGTVLSLLMGCTGKKKTDPQPIDTVIHTYKLTYDTTYIIQANGEREAGTGKIIDSTIFVTFGNNAQDNLLINNYGYAYQGPNLYFNDPRTQIFFSGADKANISITYTAGLGGTTYHTYKGSKQ